jgi:hypothetical protein
VSRLSLSDSVLSGGVAVALLAGCGGSQNPAGALVPRAEQLAHQSHLGMESTSTCPCLYVANSYGDSVTVYPVSASGNTAPIRTIRGLKTKLRFPAGVAVDDSGRIYVTNGTNVRNLNRITVFPAGATGDVSPIHVISGFKTKLNWAVGVAVSGSGQLYVANWDSRSITAYASGASGNVAPIAEITSNGLKTGCPYGLALDKSLLYVSLIPFALSAPTLTVTTARSSTIRRPSPLPAARSTRETVIPDPEYRRPRSRNTRFMQTATSLRVERLWENTRRFERRSVLRLMQMAISTFPTATT